MAANDGARGGWHWHGLATGDAAWRFTPEGGVRHTSTMAAMDKLESLLESYYGMQDEETAAREAHDIDSSAFDVVDAASELVASAGLPQLQAREKALVDETRALDSEMQTLVYNNYNKFIGATDTIRRMKDSVGDMEAKMSALVTDMRQMGGSSATVNASLQENRGKIEKLVGVKRLLLKLEFLFDLPTRLKRSIELDAQEQAVRYYTMVSGVLRKYDHIPSLHRIRVEADAIIHGLRNDLRAVVRDTKTARSGRVVDAIQLLVQLDEPRPALRAALLAYQRARLTTTLQSHIAAHAPPAGYGAVALATAGGGGGATPSALLSERSAALYTAAHATKGKVGAPASMAASSRPRATISAHAYLQSLNRQFLDGFKIASDFFVDLFETGLPDTAEGAEERRVAHEELLAFTRDLFTDYFAAVRAQLSLPPPLPTAGGATKEGAGEAAATKRPLPAAASGASSGNPFLTRAGRRGQAAVATGEEGDDDEALMAAAEAAKAQALAAAAAMGAGAGGVGGGAEGRFTAVTDALTTLLADIRGATRHVKEAKLIDRAQEAIEAILRAQLDGLFADLRADVIKECGELQRYANRLVEEEKAKAVEAAGEGEGGAPTRQYDWLQTVGAGLSAAAERTSADVSRRLVESLTEAKPLVLNGMRLLPELARVFNSLVHGQVLNALMWLASAWEALGDPFHPSRVEYADVVVEADLGLEREVAPPSRGGGAGLGGRGGRAAPTTSYRGVAPASSGASAGALRRRVAVNFAVAQADTVAGGDGSLSVGVGGGDGANGYVTGAALMDPTTNQPAFLLLLAVLCRHFAANGVAAALDAMLRSLPTRTDLMAMGVSLSDTEVDSYGAMMDVPDLIKRMQSAGRELLRQYVFQHATRLTAVIRRSMTSSDWTTHPEPFQVRLVIKVLLEDVAEVKKLAACALGDWDARAALQSANAYGVGSRVVVAATAAAPATASANPFAPPAAPVNLRSGLSSGANPTALVAAQAARRTGLIVGAGGMTAPSGGGGGGGATGVGSLSGLGGVSGLAGGRGALHMDVDRLFRGGGGMGEGGMRIILGLVDYTSDSVVRVLLRTILKSLVEWVRGVTMSSGGYHQIQVDLAAIHLALPFFIAAPPPPATLTTATSAMSGGFDPYGTASQLEELINEAAVTGSERCADPHPLEMSIVHKLASEFVAGLDVAV